MEIKDERKNEKSIFEDLLPGDVFEYDDKIFMRTDEVERGTDEDEFYNAVSLNKGNFVTIYPNEVITPLVVQLRIIRNE